MVDTELSSKRIELLKEISPAISCIAVFTDPTMEPQGLPETAAAAGALGLGLQVVELSGAEIERGFAEPERARRAASHADTVLQPARCARPHRQAGAAAPPAVDVRGGPHVRDGCLLSYGPDFTAMWRGWATYVVEVLQGAKPGDLPVEQPTSWSSISRPRQRSGSRSRHRCSPAPTR